MCALPAHCASLCRKGWRGSGADPSSSSSAVNGRPEGSRPQSNTCEARRAWRQVPTACVTGATVMDDFYVFSVFYNVNTICKSISNQWAVLPVWQVRSRKQAPLCRRLGCPVEGGMAPRTWRGARMEGVEIEADWPSVTAEWGLTPGQEAVLTRPGPTARSCGKNLATCLCCCGRWAQAERGLTVEGTRRVSQCVEQGPRPPAGSAGPCKLAAGVRLEGLRP